MANRNWLKGAAVVLIAVLALAACSGKKEGGGSAPKSGGKASPASDFSYDLSKDGSGIKITRYTGNGGPVVIPSKIEDMPVVEIGDSAFKGAAGNDTNNRDAITSIVVPSSVVTIGDSAFGYIDELTSVTLPDGLKVIPSYLFLSSPKLATVNLPASIEVIWQSSFQNCGELSNLIIPASISSVKFMAWNGENADNQAFAYGGKLPIATRQKIQSWGYKSNF